MTEVGLVLFARTALEVMQEVVPPYGSKYSKHTFTQPQLMTILCLMRFEDWTFREAEVRLAEHSDLRRAGGALGLRVRAARGDEPLHALRAAGWAAPGRGQSPTRGA